MNSKFTFINHDEIRGTHALFSPSQSSWLRYDDDKIAEKVLNQYRAAIGTEIHDFAAMEITLNHKVKNIKGMINGIESFIYNKYKTASPTGIITDYGMKLIRNLNLLPKEVFEAVRHYINDGVTLKMTAEQPLKYSDNIYGTADAIAYRYNNKVLRIHDLKTGALPAHMEQLRTYAALFCLEYGPKYNFKPGDLTYELRMYQWDGIEEDNPSVEVIVEIMNQIIRTEKIASRFDKED